MSRALYIVLIVAGVCYMIANYSEIKAGFVAIREDITN